MKTYKEGDVVITDHTAFKVGDMVVSRSVIESHRMKSAGTHGEIIEVMPDIYYGQKDQQRGWVKTFRYILRTEDGREVVAHHVNLI